MAVMSLIQPSGIIWLSAMILQFIIFNQIPSFSDHEFNLVYQNLKKIENSIEKANLKVAVGIGSCIDVIVPALKFLDNFRSTLIENTTQVNHASIHNIEELYQTFAYFFSRGASGGRYVTDEVLFNNMYNVAKSLTLKIKLGSNAPVMARRLLKENVTIMLLSDVMLSNESSLNSLASMNDLQGDIKIISSPNEPGNIHLILEYERGAKWGSLVAPRANRFILYKKSTDHPPSMFDEYYENVLKFEPDLLVVGGFRSILETNYDNGMNGLESLKSFIKNLNLNVMKHAEISSFSETQKLISIILSVVVYADSLGMNEQDLPNLKQGLDIILENPKLYLSKNSLVENLRNVNNSNETNSSASNNEITKVNRLKDVGKRYTTVSETSPSLDTVLNDIRQVVSLLTGLQNMIGISETNRGFDVDIKRCNYDNINCEHKSIPNDASRRHYDFTKQESFKRRRLLSRVHVHTLAFQIIATSNYNQLEMSNETSRKNYKCRKNVNASCAKMWRNSKEATAKSSLTANRHVCGQENIDVKNAMLVFDLNTVWTVKNSDGKTLNLSINTSDPVTCWQEKISYEDTDVKTFENTAESEMSKSNNPLETDNEVTKNENLSNISSNSKDFSNSIPSNDVYLHNTNLNEIASDKIKFKSSKEVLWEICIAPVIVCKKVKQTVGGGDNVSSAGLVLQL